MMMSDTSTQQSVAPKGRAMTDDELLSLVRQYELASLGSQVAAGATISTTVYPSNQAMTTLEIDRYNALNMYFARPLGNEVENRSQVVLPELRDTVEWIMPQLMRMFVAAKTVCRFDPENQADEQQAEMETAVVNHVFMQMNDGFFVLHDIFKDAMLMRNGYTGVYWREKDEVSVERYTGLSQIELASILQDKDDEKLEVLEHKEYQQSVHITTPQGPMVQQIQVFDIALKRTCKKGRVRIDALPPEEMRVTPRARLGMEEIPFAMHITTHLRSDLITDGYDKELINSVAAGRPNWLDIDALARNQTMDQLSVENPSDFSTQEIEVRHVILKVDFDGDGVAELRELTIAGDKVIENDIVEETCFTSCVPKRMPHRHTGISLYDEIADIQIIKTTLWRQGLDNLTISNNQRVAVDWNSVNIDDLLTSRPGGVVRGKGAPGNWIMPLEQPSNLVEQVLPALSYLDEQKTTRTGIGKATVAIDPDDLQNVAKGAQLAAMSAAALKVEMLARLLAEGVKDIFRKIHSLLIRHQDGPMDIEIGGKWVQVDPSQWRKRSRLTVNVGLGSGNREEMRTNVMALGQAQMGLAQFGMIGPKQAYETFKVMCESLGFNTPERFAMDPASPEYQQHMQQMQQAQPPQPQVQSAQIRMQTELGKQQAENQRSAMKLAADEAQSNKQLVHEFLSQHNDQMHEGTQGHKDREIQLDQNHLQIILKLIPAIAQILSAEKRDPGELGGDVTRAGGQIQ